MNRSITVLLALSITAWLAACRDELRLTRLLEAPQFRAYNPAQCGALFTMTVTEEDLEVTEFDMPSSTSETQEVCETWTGSDYTFSSTTLSESDSDPNVPEPVERADYQNDQLTPMTAGGVPVENPASVEPTLFDLLNASQDLRDASFDEPYYGIYGGGGGGNECPPSDPYCNNETNLIPADDEMRPVVPPRYSRHNVGRPGVRALIERADEISPLPEGHRRFRRQLQGATLTYVIHPKTQLLLEEEYLTDVVRINS